MSKFEAGFLGAGNMGGALAAAAARQVTGEGRRFVQQPPRTVRQRPSSSAVVRAPGEILRGSKFVFLGVKPQMIDGVVLLAAPIAASESIFVSMLAGVQLERLERTLGADKKIIRILPNTAHVRWGRGSCSTARMRASRTMTSRHFVRSWRTRASSTPCRSIL